MVCTDPAFAIGIVCSTSGADAMVVFSGVLYQRNAVPWYLTWLHDISIVNFDYAALLRSQAQAVPPAVSSCR